MSGEEKSRELKRRKVKRGTKNLLTAEQVAARYGLTAQWAYHCKELVRVKIGKYVLFPLAELERVEKMDRDKKTGAKTAPLDWCKQVEDEKRKKSFEDSHDFWIT